MSRSIDGDASIVAYVDFRVRCESLGHGEDVFLLRSDDTNLTNAIPLYTTSSTYPWYHTPSPRTITLPSESILKDRSIPRERKLFSYRYAIYQNGAFHRWEQLSDGPTDLEGEDGDVKMVDTSETRAVELKHELPLRLLHNKQTYLVNDVLGMTSGPTDIEHVLEPTEPEIKTADTLLEATGRRSNSSQRLGSTGSIGSMHSIVSKNSGVSKHVGFAPAPPPYRPKSAQIEKHQVHLNSTDGLVVVSAFLPVVLHRTESGEWTADWDYEMLLSMQTHLRVTRVGIVKWRGWHGNQGKGGSPEAGVPVAEREKVEACLLPFNCVPVWVEPTLFGEMYNGFCKGVLWPVLHNVTSVYASKFDSNGAGNIAVQNQGDDDAQFSDYSMDDVEQGPIHGDGGREAKLWASYNAVNQQFADAVVQCFNEGDLVWVHGFHLLTLPSYLTRKIPMAKVGLFLHTPFPSSEIFRTVWCREDLLRGMLNADQVGFHLYEYARHFLTCCRRLLGMNYGMIPDSAGGHTLAIDANGRHVVITSIHAGIEPPVLNQILTHTVTLEKANSIRNQFFGKVIFCAIDRMESLKGIPLKLLGFERFLRRCPEWVGNIVLIQVGISAFERGDDYTRTKAEVTKIVQRLEETYPGTLHFQECAESEMRLQQRMALLRAADVVLVTPVRDGLNLLPLEFTLAHQDAHTELGKRDGRKRGLCILSEFSSCTRVMRGAIHINPWKVSEIANAYHVALTMSEDERLRRVSCASEFVTRVTTQRWALAVMLDLKGVNKMVNPINTTGAGLGLGYRRLGMDTGFTALDIDSVIKKYRNSRSRLILLDYGGTIVSNDNLDNLKRFQMVKQTRGPSFPTRGMINALKSLCEDKRNTVFVVSGKERHSLTKTLSQIPNLGLAAEHGMFISWPTKGKAQSRRRWDTLVPEGDRSWRSLAITIMEVYTSRTHGSYIEETEMKVLWQYRDADPEFGHLQAKELEDHLANVLRNYSLDILHAGMEEGGYVEVRPMGVNKGVLAMHVIQQFPRMAAANKVDFALVLGDDHCDEPMLSVVRQIGRRVHAVRRARKGQDPLPDLPSTITLVDVSACDDYLSSDLEFYTCTVGKKPSAAANYLHDVNEVQELMESLVKVSTRDQKFYSSVDLTSHGSGKESTGGFGASRDVTVETGKIPGGTIARSRSLTEMISAGGSGEVRTEMKISSNLKEYISRIEDEDDDPCFF